MKCAKCGAEIRTGCIYCANCGQEAQIVSEINILEEDLLRSMMDEEKKPDEKRTDGGDPPGAERTGAERRKREEAKKREAARKREEEKKKKNRIRLIVLIVVLAAACAAAAGVFVYRRTHSFAYQMEKADAAYGRKDYQEALTYAGKALEMEPKSEEAMLLTGEIYALMKENKEAEKLFLQVLEANPASEKAYTDLLKLYDGQGQYDEISGLYRQAESAGAGEEILNLFGDYLVMPPVFDTEGGTYEEFFEVAITSEQNGMKIYYTLDGTKPTKKSEEYRKPIEVSEPGETVLKAVCADRKGNLSEVAQAVYEVKLKAPALPEVSPDGGQFVEGEEITVTVPDGITVYYTWDGKTPTTKSQKYSRPLKMPEGNHILSLIAVDSYGTSSAVLKCNYIYYPE